MEEHSIHINKCRIALGISTGTFVLSFFFLIWSFVNYHGIGPDFGAFVLVIVGIICNSYIIVTSKFGKRWTMNESEEDFLDEDENKDI